jgi:hypothetical protein
VTIEVKHTEAEAKDDAIEAEAGVAKATKKATDEVVHKIYEWIYDEVMQGNKGNWWNDVKNNDLLL